MTNTVIRVEKLSKQYRFSTLNHGTLYRDLQSWWAKKSGREYPTLKDISFEVKKDAYINVWKR